jgi:hypothetical protein
MKYTNLDPHLEKRFEALRQEQPRELQAVAQGRAVFLQQALDLSQAVSPISKGRHIWWMHPIQTLFPRKEHSPMFNVVSTLLIVASLLLGGGGLSVAAAQSSQPDQPLYALKLFSEQFRMQLNADPEQEWQLSLEFANRRMLEIQAMLQGGEVPPEPVQGRYQDQVEQTIRLALNQPDDQAQQALEQVRQRLQVQAETLQGLPGSGNPDVDAARVRAQEMVQERLRWIDAGLVDPAQLREQFRFRQQSIPGGNITGTPTPGSGYGPGPGECSGCTPLQNQPGGNPWTTTTPTPGSGYGPGPGDGECENCTPVQNQQGGNPWTTTTPPPGSGYGPGPGDGECLECTPVQNQGGGDPGPESTPTPGGGNGPGPQPTQQLGSGSQSGGGQP